MWRLERHMMLHKVNIVVNPISSIVNFVQLLPPATKLGQGYIFTGVCDSVHRGGVCSRGVVCSRRVSAPGCLLRGFWSRGCLVGGCLLPGGYLVSPGTAAAAGGTHPTGMHSCFFIFLNILVGFSSRRK